MDRIRAERGETSTVESSRRPRQVSEDDRSRSPRRTSSKTHGGERASRREDRGSDRDRRSSPGNDRRRDDRRRSRRDDSEERYQRSHREDRHSLRSPRKQRHSERSRSRSRSQRRKRSRSPPARKHRSPKPSPSPHRKSRVALPSQDESFHGGSAVGPGGEKAPPKQKPNFKPTGLLAKEANTVQGTNTVLKYHEPPEARKPSSREQWRMYEFKKKDLVDTVYLHQKSAWLLGRDEKVTDLHLEHPSISKQHAVIQFRYITTTNEFGDRLSKVKPYLIDLDSANGTKLNGNRVDGSRFVELVDQDMLSFGDSEREYVLMLPNGQG